MSQHNFPGKSAGSAPKRAVLQKPTPPVQRKAPISIQVEVIKVDRPETSKHPPTMSTADYDNWEGRTMPPMPPMRDKKSVIPGKGQGPGGK